MFPVEFCVVDDVGARTFVHQCQCVDHENPCVLTNCVHGTRVNFLRSLSAFVFDTRARVSFASQADGERFLLFGRWKQEKQEEGSYQSIFFDPVSFQYDRHHGCPNFASLLSIRFFFRLILFYSKHGSDERAKRERKTETDRQRERERERERENRANRIPLVSLFLFTTIA